MSGHAVDVTGVVPEARAAVASVAHTYLAHTGAHFVGLIAHGSAVKGGFIPGCSDIDLKLYVREAALTWDGQLPLRVGLAVRRSLAGLVIAPFRYVQCGVQPPHPIVGEVGPIPGAYHLVAGRLPVPEATADDLRESAALSLATLGAPTFVMGELLGPGSERLARDVRLLCTKVWPILYQLLVLLGGDPLEVWCLTKDRAIDRLPPGPLRDTMTRFREAVRAHYPEEAALSGALEVIEAGVAFLEAARAWRSA